MKGICKIVNSIGVRVKVFVQGVNGQSFEMTIKEYVTQGIKPAVQDLPVCDK